MTQLSDLQCQATPADAALLSPEQIAELLPQIHGWVTSHRGEILQLQKTFKFKNFVEAMAFTNQIMPIAEANDHHPALLIQYGSVTVNWWSHSIGGLHLNDFVLAAKTNKAYSSL
jgi:4a-hydroxytetrahydrobiopterin dehydratase